MDYQNASVKKIFSLNVNNSLWNYISADINQKIYLEDLVNTYDKKSTYTLTSSNKDIIATDKNSNGVYIWAKKAVKASVTIYQKEPNKKKIKVGTVKISTGKVITLADAANV